MNRAVVLAVVALVAVFVGCGGDSETSATTDSGSETSAAAESTEDVAAADAAIEASFEEFIQAAQAKDGEAACAMLTPEFREEWEEIQAEPIVVEGRVVEEASPTEAACPNSVLETIFAKFPFRLGEIEVDGSEAEAEVEIQESEGWFSQGPATFAEEDGSWLIAGGLIGE